MLSKYFERRLQISLAQGQPNPFSDNFSDDSGTIPDQSTNGALMDCAVGAPEVFVATLLPFMLRLMELNAVHDNDLPWQDRVWPYHIYGSYHGLKGELLNAMETALRSLAKQKKLTPYTAQLREANYRTVQFLLIRAYEANGAYYANDAVDYLCQNPARLHTGYIDNGYWATRQLLDAVTPYCSVERLHAIEDVIMAYYTRYERGRQSYRKGYGTEFGRAQLTLLNGVASERRSAQATRRLEEWRRKFRRQDNEPAKGIVGGHVGSPIPHNAADKMTDDQWLGALQRYASEDSRGGNPFSLLGGAHQLSAVLENKSTLEPKRFAELVLRFPDDTHSHYFDAVLRGLGKANEDVDIVLKVCRRCHQLPGNPSGRWICDPIRKVAEKMLPDEILRLVGWYATEAFDNTECHGRDLDHVGLNSTRGGAALAMADLIYADKERVGVFLPFLKQMVRDPSLAVRSCVAETLTATLNYDRALAVKLFLNLCDTDDVLLEGHHVERFIYHASYTHYNQILPLLERGLASAVPNVVSASARSACINALLSEEALSLAQRCLSGEAPQRIAAAQVFAANVANASNRILCEAGLIQLFNDENEKVLEEAASCFRHFKDDQLGTYTNLVEAFVASLAFSKKSFFLMHALESTTAKLPDITCFACKRYLDAAGESVKDVRQRSFADAKTVSDLIIRIYAQSMDASTQKQCLDIIDRLSELSAFSIQQELSRFDR